MGAVVVVVISFLLIALTKVTDLIKLSPGRAGTIKIFCSEEYIR
jgi:hypothetical protein